MADAIVDILNAIVFDPPAEAGDPPLNPAVKPTGRAGVYPQDDDTQTYTPTGVVDIDVGPVGCEEQQGTDAYDDIVRNTAAAMRRLWHTHYDNLVTDVVYGLTAPDKTQWRADVQARSRTNQGIRDKLRAALTGPLHALMWDMFGAHDKTAALRARHAEFVHFADTTLEQVVGDFVRRMRNMADSPARTHKQYMEWVETQVRAQIRRHEAIVRSGHEGRLRGRARRPDEITQAFARLRGDSIGRYTARADAMVADTLRDAAERADARRRHADISIDAPAADSITVADIDAAVVAVEPVAPRPAPWATMYFMTVGRADRPNPFVMTEPSNDVRVATIPGVLMDKGRNYLVSASVTYAYVIPTNANPNEPHMVSLTLRVGGTVLATVKQPIFHSVHNAGHVNLINVTHVQIADIASVDVAIDMGAHNVRLSFMENTILNIVAP